MQKKTHLLHLTYILLIVCMTAFFTACSDSDEDNNDTKNNTENNEGNNSENSDDESTNGIDPLNTNANIGGEKYSNRIEIPALNDDDVFVTRTTTVNGTEQITYSLSHNMERRHSRWVAFTFDASNRAINWNRNNWKGTEWGGDPFQADPDFLGTYVLTKEEINGNRYQRGHLVASYDRLFSQDANEQTFYYSNISPMLSGFNTGLWSNLETLINKSGSGWGRNSNFSDTLYIVKGGTIEEGQYKQNGTCPTVPDYFFMALLRLKSGSYHGIAFMFPHENTLSGTVADYAMTIDELEERTGIDFFCNLPDKAETTIESTVNLSVWNLK